MKHAKKLLALCLLAFVMLSMIACATTEDKLTLSIDKNTAKPGDAITLSAKLNDAVATDITYEITEGSDYATVSGNTLTVAATAADGAEIKVVAKQAALTSNEVTVTVDIPLEAIVISAGGTTNIMSGGSVILQKTVTPAASKEEITWSITEGSTYCAISGDVLVVNANAATGSVIKVKATAGTIESNELTFVVGTPITGISINAIGSTTIVKGNTVTMTETVTPANAPTASIVWQIVEGSDYATITDKTLVVKATAPTDAVIKVKAVAGSVESNVLTFTVAATQEEINNSRYLMSFDEKKLTLDKNATSSSALSLNVYNYNFEPVENLTIDYEIVSGSEFLQLSPNGYSCALVAKGHGTATVKATIRGTTVSQTATVNVIVPPESITLPEVFAQRPGFIYNFSKVDPKTQAAETLDFIAGILGNGVCEELKYTFTHKDGTVGDDVAVYADGKITFLKTGEITVTVTSDSGSRVETSVSYKFNINEGYNVSTFEELSALAGDATYTGNLPINIVVLAKPDGSANNCEYGFDLVPALALKAKSEQTFAEISSGAGTIAFLNKGVYLNGNMHRIDASQLRIATAQELEDHKAQGGGWENQKALLGIYPWTAGGETAHNTYRVNIYDLEVKGNCPINVGLGTSNPKGVYKIGILIGDYDKDFKANYYLDMKNVSATAANVGMRLLHIVDGKVKDTKVDNCFSNGMEVGGSIITLEDMIYGACGATGIELVCDRSNEAGVNRDQNQQVTYAGEVNVQFYNNGATEYLANYVVKNTSYTIPDVLAASFINSELTDYQLQHLKDGKGYVFVTFMFHNLGVEKNMSQVIYPGFQSGGIINAKDLPKNGAFDTTHEYIELDVGLSTVDAGKAYLYNVKYDPTTK